MTGATPNVAGTVLHRLQDVRISFRLFPRRAGTASVTAAPQSRPPRSGDDVSALFKSEKKNEATSGRTERSNTIKGHRTTTRI